MESKNQEMILILDFGGQYNQLIARRVRECGVYCEIVPYDYSIEKIKAKNPRGIIFTGGPNSVYGDDTPKADAQVFELGIPVLDPDNPADISSVGCLKAFAKQKHLSLLIENGEKY